LRPPLSKWEKVTLTCRGKKIERLLFCRKVLWYHVCPKQPILLVICRDPSGKDTFKNVKQSLGAEDPQLYAQRGPQRAAAFSFWLYSMVWYWYLKRKPSTLSWISLPWYSAKTTPSFADALATLRRILWSSRIFPSSEKPALTAKIAHVLIEAFAFGLIYG
jgi:hypothetical protein